MKLIVGLGNPGDEYIGTRHNIGFMFLDRICGEHFTFNKKMNSLEYSCIINNEKVFFIKPLSFMNLSGTVLLNYVNYYNISLDDILVIQDDLDMVLGDYKILFNRGDGGHNGIKNIISLLGSKKFYRLKIGISKRKELDTKDYVLGKFSKNELSLLLDSFSSLDSVANDFINYSPDKFIQKYNTRIKVDD